MISRAPSLQRHYPPSPLPRARPPPSRQSPNFPVMPVIWATLLRSFPSGTRRASPVAVLVLAPVPSLITPPERSAASASLRRSVLPSPNFGGLGPRFMHDEATTRSLSLRPGSSLTTRWWLCHRASEIRFPSFLSIKLRGSDYYPGGPYLPLNKPSCVWSHRNLRKSLTAERLAIRFLLQRLVTRRPAQAPFRCQRNLHRRDFPQNLR